MLPRNKGLSPISFSLQVLTTGSIKHRGWSIYILLTIVHAGEQYCLHALVSCKIVLILPRDGGLYTWLVSSVMSLFWGGAYSYSFSYAILMHLQLFLLLWHSWCIWMLIYISFKQHLFDLSLILNQFSNLDPTKLISAHDPALPIV